MAYQLNEKICDLTPYDPITEDYAIRLDANESFFPLDSKLQAQFIEQFQRMPLHRYPDPNATAVCKAFGQYYGVDAKYVTAFNGSDESLFVIFTSFLMAGDTVVTVEPDFSMYRFYGALAEAKVVSLPKEADLSISVEKLIQTVQGTDAKMVVFSNPCNPTGLGLEREAVRKLITSVDALVVLDEAYMDFWDETLIQEAAQYDNVILLRTCSKALGMAGVRLGFTVANETLTKALRAVKSPYNSNSITQALGELVYHNASLMQERTREIVDSKNQLEAQLRQLLLEYPHAFTMAESHTNFVYLQTEEAGAIYAYLLKKSIAVRCFGGKALRITAGSKAENQAVLTAMTAYFAQKEERGEEYHA